MSRPQYGNEDAYVPLTAETLLEIARVLRPESTPLSASTQAISSKVSAVRGTCASCAHGRSRLVWTSLEAVQNAVGQDYVIMWRQKASDVVFPDDVETIRRDLEEGCKQFQGFPR